MKDILILGLGLIGGSFAKAIKENDLSYKIYAFDPDDISVKTALKEGIVDYQINDVEDFVSIENLSMVIMSSSIESTKANLNFLKATDQNTLIVSLASSMNSIYKFAQKADIRNLIFSHPISGSHKSGFENSTVDLFKGKNIINVNVSGIKSSRILELEELWESIGSSVINMSIEDHEKFLMFTSHLPHLIAFAAILSISDEVNISKLSAGGLKEFLRIAESNPKMWADIFSSNSSNLINGAKIFSENMNKIIGLFDDTESLEALLSEIRNKKKKL